MKQVARKLFGPNGIGLTLIFAGVLLTVVAAQVPNVKHVKELRAIYPKLDAILDITDGGAHISIDALGHPEILVNSSLL